MQYYGLRFQTYEYDTWNIVSLYRWTVEPCCFLRDRGGYSKFFYKLGVL